MPLDEEVIETTDTEEPTEETTETEPTPEEIAKEWLKGQGIDPDTFDPKKVANLDKFEREVNKRASELGAIAKQLENQKPEKAEDDTDFDPKELEVFEKALKKVLGMDPRAIARSAASQEQLRAEQMDQVAEEFFDGHSDVSRDAIANQLIEAGFDMDDATPAKLKRALNSAYKAAKADSIDIEAVIAKRVEEALKATKKAGGDGEIIDVKKGRGSAAGAKRSFGEVMDDPNASFFDKLDSVTIE